MPSKNKEVHRVYQHKHYAQNKEYYKNKRKERQTEHKRRFAALKETWSCVFCQESDPIALDLHHINPEQKDDLVYKLCDNGSSWKRVVAEIEKCACLCANCHRKVHKHQEWANKLKDEHRIRVEGQV